MFEGIGYDLYLGPRLNGGNVSRVPKVLKHSYRQLNLFAVDL